MKRTLILTFFFVLFASGFVLGKLCGENWGSERLFKKRINELTSKTLLNILKE